MAELMEMTNTCELPTPDDIHELPEVAETGELETATTKAKATPNEEERETHKINEPRAET